MNELVSVALSSLSLAVGGLILFIVGGIRDDIREIRTKQDAFQTAIQATTAEQGQRLAILEGRAATEDKQ